MDKAEADPSRGGQSEGTATNPESFKARVYSTGRGMTDINVAGETFRVLIEGDETKPVLMLAHALGCNLDMWDKQIPAFTEHFRVVRYDSRGHGSSVANEGPYSIADLGRDALNIIDALALEEVHWLGLSLGGMVGQWLLTNAPDRIERAVLANTTAHLSELDPWNSRITTVREQGLEAVIESVIERWFTEGFRVEHPEAVVPIVAMLQATPVQGYLASCAAVRDMDFREAIRSVTNPVLVITGRADLSTPPEMGELIASSIPGAQLVTLEAAHLSNIEDEANFNKAVIDFLTAPEVPVAEAPVLVSRPRRKLPAKKVAARKAPVKQAPAKKAPAKKAAAKKAVVKKAAAKKAVAKKAPAKKAPAKKAAVKKAPVKKAPVKKAAAKKAVVKKAVVKKTAAKKAVGKKAAVKKTAMKAAPAKKAAVKKAVPKKALLKKAPARKAPAKKAGRKR
jgi:3-oxoadipate enol-lactonase